MSGDPRPPRGLVRCLPLAEWPEADRSAWMAATTPVGLMAYRRRHGTSLGVETRRKLIKGYGRWLHFLHERYPAALAEDAGARVTDRRLRAYFRALGRAANADGTIDGRFYELQATLRVIAPDFDGDIIRLLDGATMRKRLDLTPRAVTVPPVEELLDWGLGMMQAADKLPDQKARLIAFRDGLLITLLALRGRRRRSMASIRIGHELAKRGNVYSVDLTPAQVKTVKADSFSLPVEFTPYIERYLAEIRPALMGQQADHGALLVTSIGTAMDEHYMTNRMNIISKQRFGYCFGPHRFRHAISTSVAYHAPKATGLAAAVLGISPEVVAGHYDRANQVLAREAFSSVLARRKQRLG